MTGSLRAAHGIPISLVSPNDPPTSSHDPATESAALSPFSEKASQSGRSHPQADERGDLKRDDSDERHKKGELPRFVMVRAHRQGGCR